MAFFDFGTYQGLNVKMPFDDMMRREDALMAYKRQARVDAENKAKLLGADLKLQNATSDYHRGKLNEFYKQKLTEIGQFVIQNRDLDVNPAKMMEFQMMKHQLLDNDIVAADMRFKTESEGLTKFIQENPDVDKDPDVIRMLEERDRYNKYGTIDFNSPDKPFVFVNPDSKVDIQEELRAHFGTKEAYDQYEVLSGSEQDGYRRWTSQQRILDMGSSFLSNPKLKRIMQKQFDALTPEAKAKYNNDLAKYVASLGQAHVLADDIQPAKDKTFNPYTGKGRSGSGEKLPEIPTGNAWAETLAMADANPGVWQTRSANGFNAIYKNKDTGTVNLSDAYLTNGAGKALVAGSKDPLANYALDPQSRKFLSQVRANSTGRIMTQELPDKSKVRWTEWEIKMDPEEFIKSMPQYEDVIDWDGAFDGESGESFTTRQFGYEWGEGGGNPSFSFAIDEETKKPVVKFTVMKPYQEPKDYDDGYSQIFNKGIGGSDKEINSLDPILPKIQQMQAMGYTSPFIGSDGKPYMHAPTGGIVPINF